MVSMVLSWPAVFVALFRILWSGLEVRDFCVPWLMLAGVLYTRRVWSLEWLQDEWYDFLSQWLCVRRKMTCPICMDLVIDSPWHVAKTRCCQRSVCWSCIRRHAESVLDDAREEMLCPLYPCRQVLPDTVVRAAFRREQFAHFSFEACLGRRAFRKQRFYERWVVRQGLAASCSVRMEDIVACPGTPEKECAHCFVIPRELRQQKAAAEPQSNWNPRAWYVGRRVGLYVPPLQEDGKRDKRCVYCPQCGGEYCLLCQLPWHLGPVEGSGRHDGRSCLEHGRCRKQHHDMHENTAYRGTRKCPGCGVRTFRYTGCNHMTCSQCRAEWCWVCGQKWRSSHYGCSGDSTCSVQ